MPPSFRNEDREMGSKGLTDDQLSKNCSLWSVYDMLGIRCGAVCVISSISRSTPGGRCYCPHFPEGRLRLSGVK